MTRQPTLTLAFLTHAPASAAQVLEELDPATAAAFLTDVPARLGAPVLSCMSAWCAARCLAALDPALAAALLQQLPFHDGIGLLRLVPPQERARLLEELPARRAHRMNNALRYPAGSVGAWIDPDVPALPLQTTVAEALRYLRHAGDDSHVFLHATDGGSFVGALAVGQLLRAEPHSSLGELAYERITPLASRASLASAGRHPGWLRYLVLPVVGRSKAMVGGLSRASLARGQQERTKAPAAATPSIAIQLVTTFGVVCAGLLRTLTSTRPPTVTQEATAPGAPDDARKGEQESHGH